MNAFTPRSLSGTLAAVLVGTASFSAQAETTKAPEAANAPVSSTIDASSNDIAYIKDVARAYGDKTYILLDKKDAKIYLFSNDRLLLSAPALTGASMEDQIPAETYAKPLSEMTAKDGVTPAGRYTLSYSATGALGETLDINEVYGNAWKISLHSVYLGRPGEHRSQRLASHDFQQSHISGGCINVSKATLGKILAILGHTRATPIYIRPQNPEMTRAYLPMPEGHHFAIAPTSPSFVARKLSLDFDSASMPSPVRVRNIKPNSTMLAAQIGAEPLSLAISELQNYAKVIRAASASKDQASIARVATLNFRDSLYSAYIARKDAVAINGDASWVLNHAQEIDPKINYNFDGLNDDAIVLTPHASVIAAVPVSTAAPIAAPTPKPKAAPSAAGINVPKPILNVSAIAPVKPVIAPQAIPAVVASAMQPAHATQNNVTMSQNFDEAFASYKIVPPAAAPKSLEQIFDQAIRAPKLISPSQTFITAFAPYNTSPTLPIIVVQGKNAVAAPIVTPLPAPEMLLPTANSTIANNKSNITVATQNNVTMSQNFDEAFASYKIVPPAAAPKSLEQIFDEAIHAPKLISPSQSFITAFAPYELPAAAHPAVVPTKNAIAVAPIVAPVIAAAASSPIVSTLPPAPESLLTAVSNRTDANTKPKVTVASDKTDARQAARTKFAAKEAVIAGKFADEANQDADTAQNFASQAVNAANMAHMATAHDHAVAVETAQSETNRELALGIFGSLLAVTAGGIALARRRRMAESRDVEVIVNDEDHTILKHTRNQPSVGEESTIEPIDETTDETRRAFEMPLFLRKAFFKKDMAELGAGAEETVGMNAEQDVLELTKDQIVPSQQVTMAYKFIEKRHKLAALAKLTGKNLSLSTRNNYDLWATFANEKRFQIISRIPFGPAMHFAASDFWNNRVKARFGKAKLDKNVVVGIGAAGLAATALSDSAEAATHAAHSVMAASSFIPAAAIGAFLSTSPWTPRIYRETPSAYAGLTNRVDITDQIAQLKEKAIKTDWKAVATEIGLSMGVGAVIQYTLASTALAIVGGPFSAAIALGAVTGIAARMVCNAYNNRGRAEEDKIRMNAKQFLKSAITGAAFGGIGFEVMSYFFPAATAAPTHTIPIQQLPVHHTPVAVPAPAQVQPTHAPATVAENIISGQKHTAALKIAELRDSAFKMLAGQRYHSEAARTALEKIKEAVTIANQNGFTGNVSRGLRQSLLTLAPKIGG